MRRFFYIREPFTCGFVFLKFDMLDDSQSNVVNGHSF